MKSYYVEDMTSKQIYCSFIDIMLKYSDAFTLVYFRYREDEKLKKSVREVKKKLAPYKIYSKNVNEWASMVTLNENDHIYRLTMYKSEEDTEEALYKANNISDWDYPKLPMDLCFFKDGYTIFASSAHEYENFLYTDNEELIKELSESGVQLIFQRNVDDSAVFFDEKAIWRK